MEYWKEVSKELQKFWRLIWKDVYNSQKECFYYILCCYQFTAVAVLTSYDMRCSVVCITTTGIILSLSLIFLQWQGSSTPRIPCLWDDLTVSTRFSWFLLLFSICLYTQSVCNNVPFHPWPWQVLCSLIHPDPPPLPCSQTAAESQALHWLWMQLGTLSSPPLLSWLSKPIADGLYLIHNKDFFFFSSEAGFCECERQTVWQA